MEILGRIYRINNKTIQVWSECKTQGFYQCGVIQDDNPKPFRWARGQTIVLSLDELKEGEELILITKEE